MLARVCTIGVTANADVSALVIAIVIAISTHGSCLIRRQRGHPGVVLPLVISNSAEQAKGMQLELGPIRNQPN